MSTVRTGLTSASNIPALAHPLEWVCPLSVRLQSLFCLFTSLVLIGISTSLRVFLRLLSPVLIFPELKATFLSHWATYGATATNISGSFTDHPSLTITKSAAPFCLAVSRQDIFCSGIAGPLASSPFATPLDLNRFSVFPKGGRRGKSRSIADSSHP